MPPQGRRYDPRLKIATALIKKTGMPISKALSTAGYSQSVAKRGGTVSLNMRREIQQAQDSYVATYLKKCTASDGLTAEKTAAVINRVVDEGDFDQKMSAIGQHLKVILRRSDTMLDHSQQRITINQNFVVPQMSTENDWKGKPIETEICNTPTKSKRKKL